MTLLELIQEFCKRRALPVPASAMSNPDPGVMQYVGLMNELLEDLQTRQAWQRNTFETTFVSAAAEDQGDILAAAPYGFEEILYQSIFDRTQRLPLFGGVSPSEWQARKAFDISGPYYQFRLRQNRMLFNPPLPADHVIAFEYYGSHFVRDPLLDPPDPLAYKKYWTNDLDTFTLGDAIPLAWLQWKWAERKGFEYAEAFNHYERLLAVKGTRDGRPQAINIGDTQRDMLPGVFVPYGNWNQS